MKKLLSLLLVVVMVMGSFAMVFAAEPELAILIAPAPSNDIVILATNDSHCKNYASYAKVATLAKDADLLLDAGDHTQGGPLGAYSKGEYIIEIMNAVGYDICTLGNHEFDYGIEQLTKNTTAAKATYVSCNYVNRGSSTPIYDAYKIVEVKGKKVAIVGITTPETFAKSTPTYFQDANGNYVKGFCEGNNGKDLYKQVQKYVDEAKKAGADYVIGLGHLGIDEESQPWTVNEVLANVTGFDAFIDGHSHSVYAEEISGVPAVQTGTELANVAKITIKEDGTITTENVALDDTVEADEAVKAVVDAIDVEYKEIVSKVVAKSTVNLTTKNEDGSRAVRSKETNLGDLCADAYRTLLGADVAFVNGGGVRADIPAGDITQEQIITVHPFGNMACLVEVTGQQILDALELGASKAPGENGGFLQVSGITYSIDLNVKSSVVLNDKSEFVKVAGERRVKDVKVNGVAINATKKYKLAGHNYMLKNCGDGFAMFGTKNVTILKDEVMIDNQVLVTYITETLKGNVGSEYAKAAGRITIIPEVVKEEEKEVVSETPTYTVVKGDCLWNIAKKVYGDGMKWKVIYDANKAVIGNNYNLIEIGQVFVLPEAI